MPDHTGLEGAWSAEKEDCRVRIQVSNGEQVHFSVLWWHFFSFRFILSFASHIYAVLFRSTVCLPEFEMLMISSVLEIFWLSFFYLPLPRLCLHLSVCHTFSMCFPVVSLANHSFLNQCSIPINSSVLFLSFPSVSQGQSCFYHMLISTASGKEIFSLQLLNRQSNRNNNNNKRQRNNQ